MAFVGSGVSRDDFSVRSGAARYSKQYSAKSCIVLSNDSGVTLAEFLLRFMSRLTVSLIRNRIVDDAVMLGTRGGAFQIADSSAEFLRISVASHVIPVDAIRFCSSPRSPDIASLNNSMSVVMSDFPFLALSATSIFSHLQFQPPGKLILTMWRVLSPTHLKQLPKLSRDPINDLLFRLVVGGETSASTASVESRSENLFVTRNRWEIGESRPVLRLTTGSKQNAIQSIPRIVDRFPILSLENLVTRETDVEPATTKATQLFDFRAKMIAHQVRTNPTDAFAAVRNR